MEINSSCQLFLPSLISLVSWLQAGGTPLPSAAPRTPWIMAPGRDSQLLGSGVSICGAGRSPSPDLALSTGAASKAVRPGRANPPVLSVTAHAGARTLPPELRGPCTGTSRLHRTRGSCQRWQQEAAPLVLRRAVKGPLFPFLARLLTLREKTKNKKITLKGFLET